MYKNILIVLNCFYPYGREEAFLSNEVSFYKNFDDIYICPSLYYNEDDYEFKFDVPEKEFIHFIKVGKLKSFFNLLKVGISVLSDNELYKEIVYLYKNKKLNKTNIKTLFMFLLRCHHALKVIYKKIIPKLNSNDKLVLYAYWLNYDAYIASKLKDKLEDKITLKKVISRAHRADLYAYEAVNEYLPMQNFIFNKLDKIYSISNDGAEYLANSCNVNSKKICVQRLGTFDKGTNISSKETVLKIVSCSWLRKIKRVDLIVKALDDFSYKAEWSHFGSGDEYNKIKKMIENMKNTNIKCKLYGAMSNNEVINAYGTKEYNVFVNVSSNEGVPVSIMEAMSFGKIIIATDVGGTKEIVKDGINGYLLSKDFDIKELKEALEKIYNLKTEDYLRMCKASREIWEKKCNAKKNYEKFVELLIE